MARSLRFAALISVSTSVVSPKPASARKSFETNPWIYNASFRFIPEDIREDFGISIWISRGSYSRCLVQSTGWMGKQFHYVLRLHEMRERMR